jgi:putative chitinase
MCISGSVGQDGDNQPVDVKTVQVLLNLNRAALPDLEELNVDGVPGPGTLAAIRAFQARMVNAPPDGRVDAGGITLKALAAGMTQGYSPEKLQGIMVNAPPHAVGTYATLLGASMIARGIDTVLRQSHFLAQVGHESGELRYSEELASGDAYEGRRDLGNTLPGDGRRFKGRGLIQLTGRANYAAYGKTIGIDLTAGDNCQRVGEPDLAVDVACWFWQAHALNALADQDDVQGVTRKINGGLNGLADRQRQLERAKFFLIA